MQISECVPKDNEFYDKMLLIFEDPRWEVVKHRSIKSSDTQTLIFLLLNNIDIYVFCQINRFGIMMSKPADKDDGEWRYNNAIQDTLSLLDKTSKKDT
jgi:hypothetical protein